MKSRQSSILDSSGKPFIHGKPPSAIEQALGYENLLSEEDVQFMELLRHKKAKVPLDKIESLIIFWKDRYFRFTIEGRHLNGMEAEELANPKYHEDPRNANNVPYIAMCNLMMLEAVRMMGDQNPTTTNVHKLPYASDREKAISDFWKKTFQPLAFQAEWAWSSALALMVGNPQAWSDLIDNYQEQL